MLHCRCRIMALNLIHGAAKSVVAIGSTADKLRRRWLRSVWPEAT